MTRGRDRPHRFAGMWQEQACHRRRLSRLWSKLSLAYGKLSLLQSRAQPLPLCSLPVQPFAGMSRQSALPRHQQTTTSLGAPPSNGDWPLIFGLYILHCKQPLLLRLHCNGSASSTRPGPHARPRPWLSCCLAGIGLHLVLFGGDTHRCVLCVLRNTEHLPLTRTFGHGEHRGQASHGCDDNQTKILNRQTSFAPPECRAVIDPHECKRHT